MVRRLTLRAIPALTVLLSILKPGLAFWNFDGSFYAPLGAILTALNLLLLQELNNVFDIA